MIDGTANADAGIGDQHVEPAIALLDLRHDLDPARLAGDVLCRNTASPPAFLMPATTSGPLSSSISVTATDAPSRASNSATAAPMPDAPPVTSATFP